MIHPVPRRIRAMVGILFSVMTRPGQSIEAITDDYLEHLSYMRARLADLQDLAMIRKIGYSQTSATGARTSKRESVINPDAMNPHLLELMPVFKAEIGKKLAPGSDLTEELEALLLVRIERHQREEEKAEIE